MSKQLTVNKSGEIIYDSFILHKNGLEVIGTPSFEDWEKMGEFLKKAEDSVLFWLGDWISFGECNYGEKYSQALDITEYAYSTLKTAVYVSSHVPIEVRRPTLSFAHHSEVASLEPDEQYQLLDKAVKRQMSRNAFRKFVKEYKNKMVADNHYEEPSRIISGQYEIICDYVQAKIMLIERTAEIDEDRRKVLITVDNALMRLSKGTDWNYLGFYTVDNNKINDIQVSPEQIEKFLKFEITFYELTE